MLTCQFYYMHLTDSSRLHPVVLDLGAGVHAGAPGSRGRGGDGSITLRGIAAQPAAHSAVHNAPIMGHSLPSSVRWDYWSVAGTASAAHGGGYPPVPTLPPLPAPYAIAPAGYGVGAPSSHGYASVAAADSIGDDRRAAAAAYPKDGWRAAAAASLGDRRIVAAAASLGHGCSNAAASASLGAGWSAASAAFPRNDLGAAAAASRGDGWSAAGAGSAAAASLGDGRSAASAASSLGDGRSAATADYLGDGQSAVAASSVGDDPSAASAASFGDDRSAADATSIGDDHDTADSSNLSDSSKKDGTESNNKSKAPAKEGRKSKKQCIDQPKAKRQKRDRTAWPLTFLNERYVKEGHAVPSACGNFVTCKDCNKPSKMRRPFDEFNWYSHCGDTHDAKVAARENTERRIREGKEK